MTDNEDRRPPAAARFAAVLDALVPPALWWETVAAMRLGQTKGRRQ